MLPWEWVELLNTSDGGVCDFVVCAVLVESSVDLTCAENETLDLLWLFDCFAVLWVLDDPSELSIALELLDR